MCQILVLSALILFLFVATGVCDNYTITPWPYEAIVWVQTAPENAQSMVDYATKAVKNVFSFWDVPVPIPAANWAAPEQASMTNYSEIKALNALLATEMEKHAVPVPSIVSNGYTIYPPLG